MKGSPLSSKSIRRSSGSWLKLPGRRDIPYMAVVATKNCPVKRKGPSDHALWGDYWEGETPSRVLCVKYMVRCFDGNDAFSGLPKILELLTRRHHWMFSVD